MGQNPGWYLLTPSPGSVLSVLSKEELLLPSVSPRSPPEPAEPPSTLLPALPQGPLQPPSPPPCPPVIPPKPPRLFPEFGECSWGNWALGGAPGEQVVGVLAFSWWRAVPWGVLGLSRACSFFSVS